MLTDLPNFTDAKDTQIVKRALYHRELWVIASSLLTDSVPDATPKYPLADAYHALSINHHPSKHLLVSSQDNERVTDLMNSFSSLNQHNLLNQENLSNQGNPSHLFIHIPPKQYKSQLGHEYQSMTFDATDGFHPNAFVALCSCVTYGGLIVLIVPSTINEWPFFEDPDYSRIQFYGQSNNLINDRGLNEKLFIRRVLAFLKEYHSDYANEIKLIETQVLLEKAINAYQHKQKFQRTSEFTNYKDVTQNKAIQSQNNTISAIQSRWSNVHDKFHGNTNGNENSRDLIFIQGRRGRGKSSMVARLISSMPHISFVLTAQSKQSIATIEQQLKRQDPLNSASEVQPVSFYAPDHLIEVLSSDSNSNALIVGNNSCLIIEEAATIPLSVLVQLLSQQPNSCFQKIILVSTIDGYEGSGHGLALKLDEILARIKGKINRLDYYCSEPMRWFSDDVIEQWLTDTFLLSNADKHADIASNTEPLKEVPIQYALLIRLDKTDNRAGSVLNQIYALLEAAHYKTTPEDLRLLLDSSQTQVFYAWHQSKKNASQVVVVAASLVVIEGHKDLSLIADDIHRGLRRPRGHFTPIFLAQSCHFEPSLSYCYARIIRIATVSCHRRKGIATELFRFIEAHQKNQGVDFISTSFSLAHENLYFWHKQNMTLVNIGYKKEKASGAVSALFLKKLNSLSSENDSTKNRATENELSKFFNEQKQRLKDSLEMIWSNIDQRQDKKLMQTLWEIIHQNNKY